MSFFMVDNLLYLKGAEMQVGFLIRKILLQLVARYSCMGRCDIMVFQEEHIYIGIYYDVRVYCLSISKQESEMASESHV